MITFVIFFAIIAFHAYTYTNLHTGTKNSSLIKLALLTLHAYGRKRVRKEFKATDASRSQPIEHNQHKPTYSIIEVHNL